MFFDRDRALQRLGREQFDVLVIGGGITGCGVALDASSRGLRTALVEAGDFAQGTSSKSSKLVHGGLRYLQQRDYRLVYEALHERQRLLRNAPHLVRPLPFLIPLFGRDGVVAESVAKAYSSALWLYDLTGGLRIGRRHRRIGGAEALEHFPVLRTDRLVAAFLYWDAQTDDARLTLALARTAAAYGAAVANHCPVTEIVEEGGHAVGARLGDGQVVRAGTVVNAGGVWSDRIFAGAGIAIRPAKGVHVTVPAERLPCDYASVLSVPGDRRSIFVVPWGDGRFTYIGTTDTDYTGSLDDPRCTAEDTEYLLGAVNAWTSAGLSTADVTGTWAGLRPLISDARNARTADLSRRHKVIVASNGVVTVTGGKLTTYRKMAADTVDAFARRSGRSLTARLELVGSAGDGRADARAAGFDDAVAAHLAGRFGGETAALVSLCRDRPELAQPLSPKLPYLRAEVVHAARAEMATTVEDVLSRRTRALILDRHAAVAAAAEVGELLAVELGWDGEETSRQVEAFTTSALAPA